LLKFKAEYANKLNVESVGSAGDEFAYFLYLCATPRECKPTLFLSCKDISQFSLFNSSIDNYILSVIF